MNTGKIWQLLLPLILLLLLSLGFTNAFAQPNYGTTVDNFCRTYNNTTPYTSSGCSLCHTSSYSSRVEPAWSNWLNNNFSAFCGAAQTNLAPNGAIVSPDSNQTINPGDSILFQGSGFDPDNNTPLTYHWEISGAGMSTTSAQQSPGNIQFTNPGTYSIYFTVTDSQGMSDPTPATRIITVSNSTPNQCTDLDNDGYSMEGGICGLIDCDDNNASINPGSIEICHDGIDNNCNALIDSADPTAANCSLTCMDNDGDNFSPQGGICGPIDCNDNNPLVNPGMNEHCGDGIDNDCDGAIDSVDSECTGSECLAILTNQQITINLAAWNSGNNLLVIEGTFNKVGEYVLITTIPDNRLLGVTMVNQLGNWNLTIRQPGIVPCRIKISVGGSVSEIDVSNAPLNCGVLQLPDDTQDDDDSDDMPMANDDEDDDDRNDNGVTDDDNGHSESENDDVNQNHHNDDDNQDNERDRNSNNSRDDDRNDSTSANNREDNHRSDRQNSRDSNRSEDDSSRRSDSVRGVTITSNSSSTENPTTEQNAAISPLWIIVIFSLLFKMRIFYRLPDYKRRLIKSKHAI